MLRLLAKIPYYKSLKMFGVGKATQPQRSQADRRQVPRPFVFRVESHPDTIEDRHIGKNEGQLEGPAHPARADFMDGEIRDILAFQVDFP